jgi:monovalent cation/proton antiporter MnhG/PhaG subunit
VSGTLVDVLLVLGVAAELLCVLGLALTRTVFDRLHYAAAATTVGPFLILAAVLGKEGLTGPGLDAIAAVGLLFLAGPVLAHAIARAARSLDFGDLEHGPEEIE